MLRVIYAEGSHAIRQDLQYSIKKGFIRTGIGLPPVGGNRSIFMLKPSKF
ncbi:hypothetical protein NTGBS_250002 [Candidatus Nitrotoga sp. BS]|nr:hypothetical protein NTGBS_250002 [Candidatus Nitrotoga sp. BS]